MISVPASDKMWIFQRWGVNIKCMRKLQQISSLSWRLRNAGPLRLRDKQRKSSLGICCRSLRWLWVNTLPGTVSGMARGKFTISHRLPFGLCGSWSWNAKLQWCTEFWAAILDGCPPGSPIFPSVQCSLLDVRLLSESNAAVGGKGRESWVSDSVSVSSAVTSKRKG